MPFNANAISEQTEPDYILRRLTPPAIVSIAVDTPSERADFGQGTDCTFSIRPHHVRFFLKHAQAVSERAYNIYYPWTECKASGRIRFANGMRANWHVEVGGRGMLMPTNGRRKNVLYFLYCEACSGFGNPK